MKKMSILSGDGTRFQEGSEACQREFFLSLRLEVTENDGTTNCFVITKENGITALRSIGLAKVSFERSNPIITLRRKSDSTEFVEKHGTKLGPLITKSRDIIETFI